MFISKQLKRTKRHRRVRAKISGTAQRPRLSVFRSNQHIYAQLIDDEGRKTLVAVSDLGIKSKKSGGKIVALEVGKKLAQTAKEKGFKEVIFDRGGYRFHGRVMELARGAREGGLVF
ncbi:50S ribosomal protein L18 [Candidatus Azambacteria bacterium RIFCSPHIGHO2_01_FULL_44_55]|uniref:Large ribosomal subunit protein uL18 n=1 Tax=Candidatus Azambacteria bacterium RIFCSPLOWO2_02_FULL_44_14 TaxID=1797306 RepID=A0A1F5CBK6_9BACT|nr:MAG: 50S ribosomal protein L18 [Candidatus Azambacteria bacterium RIFCSPLOWO2_01_FULL_44_84]OGD32752.1 MAG: 50S ribosomal protein L18 [Candidatus Azambacteria bacterium RIFCSPHIGHO2_02_FULL_45_18]OGD40206.1 MAG: 50S ribosomal protein L18 [Candidatus Azambacteria bacterium RIFCSPLOWO2_02_FULL_44_14]OGD41599.1 MAG: 50S ribosomal protein L18 [Candidatus Azambacteria bacterium RIFCSPHIGHO2_01_FULL_44_55]OGD51988.1 MAG: 50S ribosomal protein L18 [Candidatus Azambacteria bacterium RIFOXYD1_FULL_44